LVAQSLPPFPVLLPKVLSLVLELVSQFLSQAQHTLVEVEEQ
jgi:hypothetical protein